MCCGRLVEHSIQNFKTRERNVDKRRRLKAMRATMANDVGNDSDNHTIFGSDERDEDQACAHVQTFMGADAHMQRQTTRRKYTAQPRA